MATQISTRSGHLTATDKRAIAYMLDNGMTDAQTKRKRYALTPDTESTEANAWRVLITAPARDDWGRPYTERHRAAFTARQIA